MTSKAKVATTSGTDVASALSSTLTHVNGTIKTAAEKPFPPEGPPGQKQPKVKRKYRHVAALHSKSQPSCLSHEAQEVPSFLGFRNLMVLVLSE